MSLDKEIKNKNKIIAIFHNPFAAWVILFISITLTITAYFVSKYYAKERAWDQFYFRSLEIEQAVRDRLYIYEEMLWSGVGFIYASDQIDRKNFAQFVKTLDINKRWPGIQGFGYSVPVLPEEKEAHINGVRGEGFADFKIYPEGKRDLYSSIIYLEPFDWRNQRAFGYDMWSNPTRREAMKRARDNGEAATSGIITLVQETDKNIQPGFLMYLPVYKTKYIPETLAERRNQFQGWIYAPFRAEDLMNGILRNHRPDLEFEIFDGEKMSAETLLYDSNKFFHLNDAAHDPVFERTMKVKLQGRYWTIYFHTNTNFYNDINDNQPLFIAIAGGIVDLLLFYVIYAMYFINQRARRIAESMTREVENSKEVLKETVKRRTADLEKVQHDLEKKVQERTKELEMKIKEMRFFNESMVGRELKMKELKKKIRELEDKLKKS